MHNQIQDESKLHDLYDLIGTFIASAGEYYKTGGVMKERIGTMCAATDNRIRTYDIYHFPTDVIRCGIKLD